MNLIILGAKKLLRGILINKKDPGQKVDDGRNEGRLVGWGRVVWWCQKWTCWRSAGRRWG